MLTRRRAARSFGSYFCYDNPAALEDQIQSAMGVNVAQYALLYALYR